MGAFSDALLSSQPDDSEPDRSVSGAKRVYIRPREESPFTSALSNRDSTEPAASFTDRFSAVPEAQNGFAWSKAVTDVPHEINAAYEAGAQHLTGNSVNDIPGYDTRTRGQLGPIEGLVRTGKQILGLPEIAAAPIVGAARSLIGHTMTNAEHAAGGVIAPEIAAKDNHDAMYAASKGDTDKALSAMGGKSVPVVAKAAVPTIQELKQSAVQGFHSPEVNDLVLKPEALKEYAQGAQVKLDNLGLDDSVAPTTHKILDKTQSPPANAIVTGRNIVSTRRALQNAAKSADPSERAAAVEAIEHLDEYLPTAGKHVISGDLDKASATLETARADYSAAMHAETIDNKTIQAELRAAAANSGMNVSNTIRQRMADILLKPKERRGFTQDQLDQMETIVRGSGTQNAVRAAGNLMGGGGGLGAAVTGGIGALATPGGVGGLIPVVGYALKSLSNRMTIAQAEKLSESIRAGSPLASSLQKLNQAATSLGQTRSARTVAGVVMASRNFSKNLEGIGINLSPDHISRTLLQSQASPETEKKKSVPRPVGQ